MEKLSNKRIARILRAHNVPHYIRNGRIYADTMESFKRRFESVDDLTGYTQDELKNWLGY